MSAACHSLLLTSLTNYYQKHPHFRKILYEVVEGLSPLSLRVIDWFVTHYARTNPVLYWIDETTDTLVENYPANGGAHLRKFNLYLDYRAQMKSYTKVYLDPFRRHERITFVLETTPLKSMETTVGQLNFFRWALQNHVVDYIMQHLTEIESHMTIHQKQSKEKTGSTSAATTLGAGAGNQTTAQKDTTSRSGYVMHAPCHLRFD